ncbi:NPCBM/NEW2 domain-containing protein, partial [Blautia wexlerae]|nr:NPCBM/NEW2 domain-containing protein [Blautia wexlerae]
MSSYGSNFLPTGYAARPGDVIKFYVDADENGPMPTVVFTQQIGRFGWWQQSYALKNGENVITAPRIFSDKWSTKTYPGGAIYFSNPYTSEQQEKAPRIRIEGGIDYPLFRDGDNVDAFLDELRAYKTAVEADREHSVDIVEVYSDLFILNGNLQAAAPFLNGTGDPQRTVDLHNARVGEMLSFAGIDESSFENSRNGARLNMRLMQPYGSGYAAGDHVGIQQGSANTFFKGQLVGWVYSHEIGHQLDIKGGKVPEVTNNMWANHIAVDVQNENDRVQYGNILLYVGRDDYEDKKATPHDLGMWWQLHLLNENYWPDYQKAFRAGVAKDMGLTDRQRMAVVSSYVLGMDLVEHFERYGFIKRSEVVDNALAALNVPAAPENVKPWYLWTKATKDRTSAFTEEYTPEVVSVERSGENLQVTLKIDESASDALLGFEVMEDGKVIGFTKGNTLTTAYFANDSAEHVYTARAYDLRLNRTESSAPYAINLDAPVFQITGSTLTALYEAFDPLSVVSALDRDGNRLNDSIQVESNDVDTSAKGTYSVTYSVTDAAGITSRLTVPVTVVSRFDYASDVQETSATVGWGQLQKDKNIQGGTIKLLKDGAQVSFSKGLGAHASSEIVYDLTGTGYTWFESFVGIDQAMKNASSAKAKFQVYVDGSLRYDSGAMLANTPMKHVAVDLAGAEELRLVTDSMGATSSDHTVWADARFAKGSSAPVIHVQDVAFSDPADVDLDAIVAEATATDVEDGDLTDRLTYNTDYVPGKTGAFTVTYSVTDSDGNTAEAVQNLVVVNSFVYVSDQNWKSAKVGWGSIKRDRSLNGNAIKLATENGVQTYEKGLGIHATSEVVYDLTGKDFYYFTSQVGVDNTAGNSLSSVVFRVFVDGELMAETPVMRKGMPAETLAVSLAGAKTLKLVVTDGGNGNANDHANWADAKFLTAVAEADKESLSEAVERAYSLDESRYTVESWESLTDALEAAEDVLSRLTASQEETDEALENLLDAMDALEVFLDTEALEEIIELARSVASIENVSSINPDHQQAFVDNLLYVVERAEKVLADPDVTQEEIDQQYAIVRYCLWDMNPDFTPGWEPFPSR